MPRKPSQKLMDIQAIKQTITNTGEFRVHLTYSRSGMGCTARMWHPDGFKVGHAGGCGYDRAGAALGQAIELFFAEEIKALPPRRVGQQMHPDGLYGLAEYSDGKRGLDGACGLSCMVKILEAMGFETRDLDTGKYSRMILATRKGA